VHHLDALRTVLLSPSVLAPEDGDGSQGGIERERA
jgi:hypothetical protein